MKPYIITAYRWGKYACIVEECKLNKFSNDDNDHVIEIYRTKSRKEK